MSQRQNLFIKFWTDPLKKKKLLKMPGPVLVFSSGSNCGHCTTFKKNYWDTIKTAIKNKFPSIRIEELVSDKTDFTKYPKDTIILNYVPCFYLIPGAVWDDSMNSKTSPLYSIREYNYPMNHVRTDKEVMSVVQYNSLEGTNLPVYNRNDSNDFIKWITETTNSNDFKDAEKGNFKISKKIAEAAKKVEKSEIPAPVKKDDICAIRIIRRR